MNSNRRQRARDHGESALAPRYVAPLLVDEAERQEILLGIMVGSRGRLLARELEDQVEYLVAEETSGALMGHVGCRLPMYRSI